MIWNSGQLHQGWTVEKLFRKHESAPFNPEIANCFFRAGLIEAWGRGIEKMSQTCMNAGIHKPEILYEESGIWLTFNFQKSSVKSSVKILDLLKLNPNLTIPELAQELFLTERAVQKTLKKLQETNQLKRIGSKRAGSWEVIIEWEK
jgi:ATP-dependent DNA helicase RecG